MSCLVVCLYMAYDCLGSFSPFGTWSRHFPPVFGEGVFQRDRQDNAQSLFLFYSVMTGLGSLLEHDL